ncbi:MAG: branched-chain amino acid ABC transporter permease [Acidimicrobiia bacterium]
MAQVTKIEERVEVPPPPLDTRRQAGATSVGKAVRWGLIGGVGAIFVSAIGMVQGFEARIIIDPFVTLGYLTLFVVPFVFGYVSGRPPPALEGYEQPRAGGSNVAAGLIAGGLTGVILALFVLFVDTVNVRGIFVNISPALVNTLTFDRGPGGALVWLMLGSLLAGTVGGGLHLVPGRWRKPLVAALLWLFTFGLLEELVAQVLRGVKLPFLDDVLYARGGGLRPRGALTVAVVAFALYAFIEPRRMAIRRRVDALSSGQRKRYAALAIAVGVIVLALVPIILGRFLSEVADLVGIFLLMALGLNIVVGYAGLLDLGYVAFFAVGAYTTAVLTSPDSPGLDPELILWLALPFIMLAAAFSGLLVGVPVLRMRGDYLAIVTLGFGEIARILFLSDWFKPVFGGAQGITRIPGVPVGSRELNTPVEFFYPIAALVLLAAYVSWALQDSRIGRAWMAMREDEPVAEAVGINIVNAKLSAFIVGAILASFGGALFASKIGVIFPNSFSIIVSIIVLVIIIVGGMGSLPGVAVGALVIVGIPQLLREFEEYRFLLYGALLIFMMLLKPEGLLPSKRRVAELHQEEMMQDAWLGGEREQRAKEHPASEPHGEKA